MAASNARARGTARRGSLRILICSSALGGSHVTRCFALCRTSGQMQSITCFKVLGQPETCPRAHAPAACAWRRLLLRPNWLREALQGPARPHEMSARLHEDPHGSATMKLHEAPRGSMAFRVAPRGSCVPSRCHANPNTMPLRGNIPLPSHFDVSAIAIPLFFHGGKLDAFMAKGQQWSGIASEMPPVLDGCVGTVGVSAHVRYGRGGARRLGQHGCSGHQRALKPRWLLAQGRTISGQVGPSWCHMISSPGQ